MNTIDDHDWQPRLQRLADRLAEDGFVRTPPWRKAVEATPRHVFVPRFYADGDDDTRILIDGTTAEHRQTWLDAVYSDDTLVTQLRSAPVPDEYGGGEHTRSTSSSTAPGLMLAMLEDLDVRDDHCVLEIGTGTGYTAALLCARLGGANVASIDIHPEVVEQARSRLAALGHAPHTDGR